jgi:hypothetical protein
VPVTEALGKKQQRFAECLALLLEEIRSSGLEVRLRELWRSQETALTYSRTCRICRLSKDWHVSANHNFKPLGIANSTHCHGLAIDLFLVKDGEVALNNNSGIYTPIGEFWEELGGGCAWGGRFDDPGHFSIEHAGAK